MNGVAIDRHQLLQTCSSVTETHNHNLSCGSAQHTRLICWSVGRLFGLRCENDEIGEIGEVQMGDERLRL